MYLRAEDEENDVKLSRISIGGLRPAAALAIGASALALVIAPTAGFALGGDHDSESVSLAARGSFASFTPATVNPRLAELVSSHRSDRGRLMRFTPPSAVDNPGRAVTVAVRVDSETAQAISVRSAIAAAQDKSAAERTIQIAPIRYNLGLSRGYHSFAQAPTQTPLSGSNLRRIELPDLSAFEPSQGAKGKPSRFAPLIELEEADKTGRSPNTREALGDQTVGVGGSYRITGRLDVTAGVRYSQERDRLAPLADSSQDSQAVYVGTQFSF